MDPKPPQYSIERTTPTELAVSPEFKSGIRMAMDRLEGVLDSHAVFDARELSMYFERYINYMLSIDIQGWDGAFLDGIFHVLKTVKSYIGTDKKPRVILQEMKNVFKETTKLNQSFGELTPEEITERRKILRAFVHQYHPDSPTVRLESPDEIERRTQIFKLEIQPAIDADAAMSLNMLRSLRSKYQLDV